jgi:hypothetical protein
LPGLDLLFDEVRKARSTVMMSCSSCSSIDAPDALRAGRAARAAKPLWSIEGTVALVGEQGTADIEDVETKSWLRIVILRRRLESSVNNKVCSSFARDRSERSPWGVLVRACLARAGLSLDHAGRGR